MIPLWVQAVTVVACLFWIAFLAVRVIRADGLAADAHYEIQLIAGYVVVIAAGVELLRPFATTVGAVVGGVAVGLVVVEGAQRLTDEQFDDPLQRRMFVWFCIALVAFLTPWVVRWPMVALGSCGVIELGAQVSPESSRGDVAG
jgi:hypothetical protein